MVEAVQRNMIFSILVLLSVPAFIMMMHLHPCALTQISLPLISVYAENNSRSDNMLHKNHYIIINDNNKYRLTMSSSSDKVSSGNNSSPDEKQYMIQIKRPRATLDWPAINQLLNDSGIKLDPNYFEMLNAENVIVRGSATPEAIEKAEKKQGVLAFPDLEITSDSQVGPDINID